MFQVSASFDLILSFGFVLARVGGLMVFAPFLGSFAVSRRIRVLLSLAVCISVFPILQDYVPDIPADKLAYVLAVSKELLVGLVLGLVGQLLLASLQVGGTMMGFQMGFSLVNVIDPQTQVEVSVLSVLHNLAGLLLFILLNGHHMYLEVLADSYRVVPVFTAGISEGLMLEIGRLAGGVFTLGLQLAAPIVAVGITVDILLGVVGRSAPQIHILIAGLPLKVLVGFFMVTSGAGVLLPYMRENLGRLQQDLYIVLNWLSH